MWCMIACSYALPAYAHPTPGSVALLDLTVDGARLEQDVPIEELERALHQQLLELAESPEHCVQRHVEMLKSYAASQLYVRALGEDTQWTVQVLSVEGHGSDDGPRARFTIALHAPSGQASSSLLLRDTIVAHEVVSHYIRIYVRSDFAAGVTHLEPQLAGVVHAGHNEVNVLRSGSFWNGLRSVVSLGMEHIATGTDHLLFLLALLLVAPVRAQRGRWSAQRDTREAVLALTGIVSAFTVGHSLTLAFGALGWVNVPSALVEAAIAATVLLTAAHALRPLFARREALFAGLFGLIHGLAFASTLSNRDLGRAQALWTLLGFNTGIELAQLGILCLVVPWILLVARTHLYAAFRGTLACVTGVLALGWLLERTTSLGNPVAWPLAWLEAHPLLLLAALAVFALTARALDRRAREEVNLRACRQPR